MRKELSVPQPDMDFGRQGSYMSMKPRRSIPFTGRPSLLNEPNQGESEERDLTREDYSSIIRAAHKTAGVAHGAFPQEWESLVLVDSGQTAAGYRLVIFAPCYLQHVHGDPNELDRFFKFALLRMDSIVRKEKFVLVFCNAGSWAHSGIAQRFRVAYDIVPRTYSKNLKGLLILHPTLSLKFMLWSLWPWISSRLWRKMRYFESLDELCREIHPEDSFLRADIRRNFPRLVQREDAIRQGLPAPSTFGVRLKQLCDECGMEWFDAASGRWYPRLPPPVVLLCEALERQAADEAFCHMFTHNKCETNDLVQAMEEGQPLDPETPLPTLWCGLKLFLDCLPGPMLGFATFDDLVERKVRADNEKALRSILVEALQRRLAVDVSQTVLYLASFFKQMSLNAEQRAVPNSVGSVGTAASHGVFGSSTSYASFQDVWTTDAADSSSVNRCTADLIALVFAPCFVKPRSMKGQPSQAMQAAIALVKLLITEANDQDLWVGTIKPAPRPPRVSEVDSETSDSEDWDGD